MALFAQLQKFVGQITGQPAKPAAKSARQAERPAKQVGFVIFPKRPAFPPVRCIITSHSKEGAEIEFKDPPPDTALLESGVRLFIETRNHERDSQIVWQKGHSFGLRFFGPVLDPSRSYRALGV